MEKITLKYECPDCGNEGNITEKIVMTFNSEGMDIWDFADRFRQFALAIGYHPHSIDKVFVED